MTNTRNLRLRRKGYAAVVYVPTHLRDKVGKREIVRGPGTRDLREANARKLRVIAEIHLELAKLNDPLEDARNISKEWTGDETGFEDGVYDLAEKVELRHGRDAAVRFYKVATRQAMPVSMALERWMEEADGITEGTKLKYRGHVQSFIIWSGDIDANKVDRRMAGEYVSHVRATPNWRTGAPPSHQTVTHTVRAVGRLWCPPSAPMELFNVIA